MRLLKKISILCSCLILLACHAPDKNVLRVGTIAGPETQLMEVAKNVAEKKYGLKVEIIEFSDYLQPDAALNDGSIDVNMFQHQPFLDQQNKDHHYHLVSIAKTFIYPMGIYSSKHKSLQSLPNDAIISIPNDPSNEGRALLLLQHSGLIKLKTDAGLFATPIDIIENPKHLTFKELDAAQLTRTLADVDASIINSNFAIPAGLSPTHDAIYHEDKHSNYVNIFVVRQDKVQDEKIQTLIKAFQSNTVLEAAKKIFNNQAIAVW